MTEAREFPPTLLALSRLPRRRRQRLPGPREYGLHRVQAHIQPDTARSIALVRGPGFRYEGLSPRDLKLAGRGRDHERRALTLEDWKPDAGRPAGRGPRTIGV